MKDDLNIEELYRNAVSNNSESPSDFVWDRLEDSLDTANVWDKVATSLDRWRRRVLIWRFSMFFMGVLLLSSGAYYLLSTSVISTTYMERGGIGNYSAENEHIQSEEFSGINNNRTTINNGFEADLVTESASSKNIARPKESNYLAAKKNDNSVTVETDIIESDDASIRDKTIVENKNESLTKDKVSKESYSKLPLLAISISPDLNKDVIVPDAYIETVPKYAIGLQFGVQNQWLLAPDTYYGLRTDVLNSTNIDFGLNGNLIGEYSLNNNLALFTKIGWKEGGQSYTFFEEGKLTHKEIDLNYVYNTLGVKRNRGGFVLSAGITSSILLKAEKIYGADNMNITKNYKKVDLGVEFGVERVFAQFNDYSLFAGAYYYGGVFNIYKGSIDLPKTLNNSFNSALYFQLGIKRNFGTKI